MERLYFAYGSNLLAEQLIARVGAADLLQRGVRKARLKGRRLVFRPMEPDGPAYADVLPAEEHDVLGVAYLLRETELQALDRFEKGYDRRTTVAAGTDGAPLEVEVYYSKRTAPKVGGIPSAAYLDRIVAGARQHGLFSGYIEGIVAQAASGSLE